jgi:hypothetical protein
VLEHHEQQTSALLREADERVGFPGSLLALAARHEADPTYIRLFTVLVAESVDPEHPAHDWFVARYERVRARLTDRFRDAQALGEVRPGLDPVMLARQVIAMFDGIQLQYLLAGGALDLVTPLRELLDSFTD